MLGKTFIIKSDPKNPSQNEIPVFKAGLNCRLKCMVGTIHGVKREYSGIV